MTDLEKYEGEFAKRGYLPVRLKRLETLLKNMQDFTQYAAVNQYHADAHNRKLFLLSLEVEALALDYEELAVEQAGYQEEFQLAQQTKRKPRVDEKEFKGFVKRVDVLGARALAAKTRAVELVGKIQSEYENGGA
ncbi:MAG: hypothetical protein WC607_03370 [Candidatus Micrarchaeia archaeon]